MKTDYFYYNFIVMPKNAVSYIDMVQYFHQRFQPSHSPPTHLQLNWFSTFPTCIVFISASDLHIRTAKLNMPILDPGPILPNRLSSKQKLYIIDTAIYFTCCTAHSIPRILHTLKKSAKGFNFMATDLILFYVHLN